MQELALLLSTPFGIGLTFGIIIMLSAIMTYRGNRYE